MATFMLDLRPFLMDWMAQQIPAAPSIVYFPVPLQLHPLKRAIFSVRMTSRLEMLLTMDSTDLLVFKIVSGVSWSKESIFCTFSPSALRMWERAACCRATERSRSVIA